MALHQYPQQEEHWAEDLGQNAKSETLDVYVLGTNYDTQKDALLLALDKPGSGTLVHPYLGALDVQMGEYTWTISSKQGGYCKITIEYSRAGTRQFPADQQQNGKQLLDCCNAAKAHFNNDFSNVFSVLGYPAFVLQSALDQLTDMTSFIESLKQLGALFNDDDAMSVTKLGGLITAPELLAKNLSTLITSINHDVPLLAETFSLYELMAERLSGVITVATYKTPSREQQLLNQAALNQLIKGLSIVESASMIAGRDSVFPTYSAAMIIRDTLLNDLDAAIQTSSDGAYGALANLQSAIVKRVDDIAPGLQKIEHIQLAQSIPVLVLAHQLYQTADKAEELIARNQIIHPLFVPAGKALEVLS